MSRPLPHNGVFVRLGVSDIHRIGVFAGQPVAAGANVFFNDTREISWVPRSLLADRSLDEFHRRFHEGFAIRRGDGFGCPANFNLLSPGWYVNEPARGAEPNLVPKANFDLVACRASRPPRSLRCAIPIFGKSVLRQG